VNHMKAETYVDCPPAQAHVHLDSFFRGHPTLALRVPLVAGTDGTALERDVKVSVARIESGFENFDRLAVTWEPTQGGPFPKFAGRIEVKADEDYDSFRLVLSGSYTPPFGLAGEVFDMIVGRWLAIATARDLLERLRTAIESSYRKLEAGKALRRAGVA
jgi:hypothetical protein